MVKGDFMFRVLFLLLIVMSSIAFSQVQESFKLKAYEFDEFGKTNNQQWKAKLDKFKEHIICQSENSFYVILYPTKKNNMNNLGKSYLDYLITKRCIDPPRIILIKGEIRKEQKTELWIVPAGAEPPTP